MVCSGGGIKSLSCHTHLNQVVLRLCWGFDKRFDEFILKALVCIFIVLCAGGDLQVHEEVAAGAVDQATATLEIPFSTYTVEEFGQFREFRWKLFSSGLSSSSPSSDLKILDISWKSDEQAGAELCQAQDKLC